MSRKRSKERQRPPQDASRDYAAIVFAAEIGSSTPTADLHGMDKEDAKLEVDRVINHAYSENADAVKIIHGRGTGRLRQEVQRYLKSHPMVEFSQDAQEPGSIGGVTIAVITKKQ